MILSMAKKKIDIDKYASGLFQRTEQYADKVRQHYATAVDELLKLSANRNISPDELFSFSDNKKLSGKANNVLRGLYSAVYNEIKGGVMAEWEYANLSCDALIESIFGKGLNEDNHFARWFSRNQEAMDAFFARKSAYGGMNLSQKVWKYTGDLKTEMELALSLSLGQGDSASTVSRKVRQYLQEPDKLFRRIKTGTDADGNPLYKLSKAAKAYHPGRGVYRSSYKNAMRLTRTETNMAYRASEQDRWQRMDFVVGYEVKRSKRGFDCSICESLKGRFPKDFVFRGWHAQCRCVVVPILATEDEFVKMQEKMLAGESPTSIRSVNTIRRPHEDFYNWWEENKGRVETATTMPYWVQDNQDYINKKRKIRVRTDEEREAIRKKWAERSKKYQLITKMANNVLKVAQEYLTALQSFIDKRNIGQMNIEARTVAKQIVEIRKDEQMLSALIPDVHEWKKQFTSAELHEVYDAVEKKIADIKGKALKTHKYSTHLEQELADFDFEIKYVADPTKYKPGAIQYPTWKVSQAAYAKQHALVLDAIDWENIDNVLQEALTFKTKSKPYLDLIDELQVSISAGDKAKAQSIVADMQTKREALKRAADARAKKKTAPISQFGEECFSKERKDAAPWHKKAGSADDYFHDNAVEFWQKLTDEEKEALWGYTAGSGYITEPLRAIKGHYYYYEYRMAETDRHIRAMTTALNKQTLKEDVWIKRDSDPWNIDYIFGVELDKYRSNPSALVGKTGLEDSFQSCGSCKETRFTCTGPKQVIMNIYCPKGTNGAYAQPWSSCGTFGRSWNGKDKSFPNKNSENEVLLQRGAVMRITKAEYKGGMWYIDVDVLGFNIRDYDLEKGAGGYFCKFK